MPVNLLSSPPDWDENLISSMAQTLGFVEEIDANHTAYFLPASSKLAVIFEAEATAQNSAASKLPAQMQMFSEAGFSVLGITAKRANWYRSAALIDFLKKSKKSGPLRMHSDTVFFGVSMGGYAAATYAALATAPRVVAITPQATLERSQANGWEPRFKEGWKEDFSGPFGFAPHGVAKAKDVWLFHDPHVAPDALHVALFQGGNIRAIRCRHYQSDIPNVLARMGVWEELILGVSAGTPSELDVYRLLRKRKDTPIFQKRILGKLSPQTRPLRAYQYCKAVLELSDVKRPHFANTMNAAAKLCGKALHTTP